jgi:myo-inositol catabolism protein IolC
MIKILCFYSANNKNSAEETKRKSSVNALYKTNQRSNLNNEEELILNVINLF